MVLSAVLIFGLGHFDIPRSRKNGVPMNRWQQPTRLNGIMDQIIKVKSKAMPVTGREGL
jgi:hypothetical protein